LPAANFTRLRAGTLIFSRVCGFTRTLAAVSLTEKTPKPTRRTVSPFSRFSLMASRVALTNSVVSLALLPALPATALIKSERPIAMLRSSFVASVSCGRTRAGEVPVRDGSQARSALQQRVDLGCAGPPTPLAGHLGEASPPITEAV